MGCGGVGCGGGFVGWGGRRGPLSPRLAFKTGRNSRQVVFQERAIQPKPAGNHNLLEGPQRKMLVNYLGFPKVGVLVAPSHRVP